MTTKIKKIIIGFFVAVTSSSTALAPVTFAQSTSPTPSPVASNTGTGCTLGNALPTNAVTFFPAWYDGIYCANGNIVSPADSSLAPEGNSGQRFGTWLTIIAMNIVRMLLYVVGYASLIFIIWGGFKYMTQGDNTSGTVAARKTIQNAIIGLVISIMSVSIVTFIVSRISGA